MASRWYVIHVYSGFEKKVASSIREQADQKGLSDSFEEILVPTEEVVEVKRGAKVSSERKFFPGYVLDQDGYDRRDLASRQKHGQGHRVSRRSRRSAVADQRATKRRASCTRCRRGSNGRNRRSPLRLASRSEFSDGPFTSFNGLVEEVDEERARLKVAVSIFGRATPVELEYSQVEKV